MVRIVLWDLNENLSKFDTVVENFVIVNEHI
jgi:hypothetical protein